MPGSNYGYSTGEAIDSQTPLTTPSQPSNFTVPGYLKGLTTREFNLPKFSSNFKGSPSQQQTSVPEVYQTKTFDRDAKLKEMYGTNASKRDVRKFNKYWNSDQRWADQDAFEAAEHQKYTNSLDNRWNALHEQMKQKTTSFVNGVQGFVDQSPKQNQSQNAKPFNTNYWLAEAQKVNPAFKSIQDVKDWQAANGLVDDGKFGKNSIAKWNELNSANLNNTEVPEYLKRPGLAGQDIIPWYDPTATTTNNKTQKLSTADAMREYYSNYGKQWGFKQGGQINKHQQGGTMQNEQELQKAFMAYLIEDAAAQGMQIQSEQDLQAYAQQLGEEGLKAKYQEFMQKMQGGVKAALGAKLNYIHKLKGNCPEGEELIYMKQGGRMCPVCQKKAEKAENGKKLPKKNAVSDFKEKRKQINPNDTVNTKFGPRDLNGKTNYKKYDAKKENYDFETRMRVQEKDEKSGKKVIGSACGSKMKKKK